MGVKWPINKINDLFFPNEASGALGGGVFLGAGAILERRGFYYFPVYPEGSTTCTRLGRRVGNIPPERR